MDSALPGLVIYIPYDLIQKSGGTHTFWIIITIHFCNMFYCVIAETLQFVFASRS